MGSQEPVMKMIIRSFAHLFEPVRMALGEDSVHRINGFVLALITALSFYNPFGEEYNKRTIVIIIITYFLIILVRYFMPIYKKINEGYLVIQFIKNSKIVIMQGNFQDNLGRLFETLPSDEIEKLVVAFGIDRGGDIKNVFSSGIAHCTREYLDNKYICNDNKLPSEVLQESIERYCRVENSSKVRKLEFCECIPTEVSIKKQNSYDNKYNSFTIVMTPNTESDFNEKKNELIDWVYSDKVVPAIFDCVEKAEKHSLLIGMIGTKRPGEDYQVVVTEIINQFASRVRKNADLNTLYLSIREEDYCDKMTLMQLYGFLHSCVSFYKHREY